MCEKEGKWGLAGSFMGVLIYLSPCGNRDGEKEPLESGSLLSSKDGQPLCWCMLKAVANSLWILDVHFGPCLAAL